MRRKVSTLVELLQERATTTPDRTAYIFLADGDVETDRITYAELHQRARAIGAWLQSQQAAGERVVLLYPSGIDYIAGLFGCLYAGAIAVPAYPPRHNRTRERLEGIINDAQPAFVLTTSEAPVSESLKPLRVAETDQIETNLQEFWREPSVNENCLALLQYTSGSTAAPKGVMLSHANLLFNEQLIQKIFRQTQDSIVVGWLPLYHDMGLIGSVLQPLYTGSQCILMPPSVFLQQPVRWLQTISRYHATTSGGPNFAYELCVRKIDEEQRKTLDLHTWSVAFNGAEPIRADTMDRFVNAFAPCGFSKRAFRPCYGLAEATLIVCGQQKPLAKSDNNRDLASCGQALGQQVIVVDTATLTECAGGAVGEIWVAGQSVAQGYWNNSDETQAIFRAHLAGGQGPYLRTGDLGFKSNDELFITGRLKDLIIVRGVNHYPQEIEYTVERSHPSLSNHRGAAFSIEVNGEERLAVVQELRPRRQTDHDEIVKAIRQAIAQEHELNIYSVALVKPGTIPVTTSGKIQRRACQQAFLENAFEILKLWQESNPAFDEVSIPSGPPWDPSAIQAWLLAQIGSRLGLSVDEVDVDRPVVEFGLDSLAAVEITHGVESKLGMRLPLASLLGQTTVRALAAQLVRQFDETPRIALTHQAEPDLNTPLSHGQRSLWFMQRLAPESTAYSIVSGLHVVSELDVFALQRAFQLLIDRHPMLRMTFPVVEDEPVQRVHDRLEACFEYADASSWSKAELDQYIDRLVQQPFDLEVGPLMRINVLKRAPREHVLLIAVHHIVCDLWSLALLLQELGTVYKAEVSASQSQLPLLTVDYRDYTRWQAEMLSGPEGDRLWSYWQAQLAGDLPVLEIPTDRARPAVQTYRGASLSFEISAALTQRLKQLGQASGATLYMVLLAAFQVLLHRYSNQEHFAIGSSTSGRSLEGLAKLVGYLVNPVVIRADLSGRPTFESLLGRVRQTVLSAFEHQDYPFALLVERLQPVRSARVSPLFQTMFVLQKAPVLNEQGMAMLALGEADARIEIDGLTLESMAVGQRVAQFDLTLIATEVNQGLRAALQYNTDLFDVDTIVRMASNFEVVLEAIVADPRQPIALVPLVSEAERRRQLIVWNDTRTDVRSEAGIIELFEQQAEESADAIAVTLGAAQLTYRELNDRANQLARYLLTLEVGPEVPVGLLMDRSLEMVIGLLAVLKAGAAYVPLDPDYPLQRVSHILRDAGIKVLLTQKHLAVEQSERVIALDRDWNEISRQSVEQIPSRAGSENLAYIIYTSGSTGGPKGVMVTNGGLVNYLHWARQAYPAAAGSGVPVHSSIAFDLTVTSLWLPLVSGQRLMLLPQTEGVAALGQSLQDETNCSLVKLTPANLELLSHQLPPQTAAGRVRMFVVGGEALRWEQLRFWQEHAPGTRIVNEYGPTETVVGCCSYEAVCDSDATGGVPIGRPVANTRLYVLDPMLQPTPIGVSGELGIAGAGVARGYLGRPDLTAQSFVPDPFSAKPGERFYRTGDVTRYRADGILEYLGRNDQQIKIRGYRIELGEIESLLIRHEGVRAAVVTVHGEQSEKRSLVAYIVPVESPPTTQELRRYLQTELPGYMVPSAFVVMNALPMSRSGKIDRAALPAPASTREEAIVSKEPRTPVEEVLAGLWCDVLGREKIGVDENFFELGGHSLLAAKVVSRIRDAFSVEVPLRSVFETPTIAQLAQQIENSAQTNALPLKRVSRDTAIPLSAAQQRLWFLDQMRPGDDRYNIPAAIRFRGRLNVAALEDALREIVRRHQVLRTRFINSAGEPVQVIESSNCFRLRIVDTNETQRLITSEAQHPFDLSCGPLRATLLREEQTFVLMLTVHHIASDGWSADVFIRELGALYEAYEAGEPSRLAELPVQYGDYAVWQREWLSGAVLQQQLSYWKQQLAGAPAVLELPADRGRGGVQSYRGGSERVELSGELRRRLEELSRGAGVTLFMTLLAGWQALLHRYTEQEQVVVGTPIAGRTRGEVEGLIGFFANTLVLRTEVNGDLSFRELLQRVREVCLGAYSHQDLPFEKLVEELQPERSLNHNPLFQVFFNMFRVATNQLSLPRITTDLLLPPELHAKFDLSLYVIEQNEGSSLELTYNADLFRPERIVEMLAQLNHLLRQIVEEPNNKISDFSLVTSRAKATLPDPTLQVQSAWTASVQSLFAQQVKRTPNHTAIVDSKSTWSYLELHHRSNQLAHQLSAVGIRPQEVVAVYGHRSASLVCALLGVLKAGAAFMILDPSHPDSYLLECLHLAEPRGWLQLAESGSVPQKLEEFVAKLPNCRVIDQSALDDADVEVEVGPTGLAYVAFTSGSTGKPKGIAGEHGPLSHFVQWQTRTFQLHSGDRFTLLSGLSHDPLLRDIFTPLSIGATLCIPDWEQTVISGDLAQWMGREKISVMHLTPATLQLLIGEANLTSLRYAFFGGDKLAARDIARLRTLAPQVNCVNFYGATETPQAMAFFPVDINELTDTIPIGRGIEGVQLLVLNRAGQLAGVSEAGEIYVRTPYLARGYLNNDTLTAEKFIPDLFGGGPVVRLYRTGDRGRYLPDGNVEFLGRLDREIKVLGHRVDPEGIEVVLRSCPAVREATVVSSDGELVAYVVKEHETSASGLRSYLNDRLPPYMIPGAVVFLDALPLTPNGKVDLNVLPPPVDGDRRPDTSFTSARTPIEEVLCNIWSDLLGVRQISVHDNFFELGGHSLLATRLISRVRETFGVNIELRALFEVPTVAGLSQRIESSGQSRLEVPLLPRGESEAVLPLSYAQERLWFLEQLAPGNPFYNINSGVRLSGVLVEPALRQSLGELLRRHAVLRTRIVEVSGRAVQQLAAPVKPALPLVDLSGLAGDERERVAQQLSEQQVGNGFELAQGELLRPVLLRLSDREHWFLCTMHHIISDGWSMGVFVRELGALYEAYEAGEPSRLAELPVQYGDYAVWQREWLSGAVLQQQLSYWKQQLAGAPAVLELPADRGRGGVQSYRGGSERVELSGELRRRLEELSRGAGVTLFMTLLAGWQALLHRYTEQEQVVVGTPIAGRTRGEVEGLIGFFANTLVLRTEVNGDLSFRELLQRVREVCLGAYSHQDLPFEKLVEELQPERSLNHNPLVQVLFNLLTVEPDSTVGVLSSPRVTATLLERTSISAKFDLNLALVQTEQGLGGTLEYSSDLFDPPRVRGMIEHFQTLLEKAVANPGASISELVRDIPKQKQTIAIVSTFTAEPLEESLSYWMRELNIPTHIRFGPYNQVFQQLLDPSSLLRTNDFGVNIILLRLEDWLRDGNWAGAETKQQIDRTVAQLLRAVKSATLQSSTPYLIGLCPLTLAAAADAELSSLHREVEQAFEAAPEIHYLNLSALAAHYGVSTVFDSYANELAHVPFTQEFFAAMGTLISRRMFALQDRAYKVIALDCDQTLWNGICGEDGADGVSIGPCHSTLQRFMLSQLESGKLLCLISKNNEADVLQVFRHRSEMLLKPEHFAAMRINWRSKSENLQSVADALQLSLNGFIFIDDSSLECAEVRAHCPEVMTLHLPAEEQLFEPFLQNVWAFDQLRVTGEDRLRHQLYQQERERDKLRRQSGALENFLAGLDLRITIKPVAPQQYERVAQLTQRTNQFNLTGVRRSTAEIEQLLRQENVGCEVVEVSDRFGEYGLVGALIFKVEPQALKVDTFLLSCRALGRNVEDNMLVKLAELTGAQGCKEVHLALNPTPKNGPASDFLERVFENQRLPQNGGFVYVVAPESIANHPQLVATNYGFCFRESKTIKAESLPQGMISQAPVSRPTAEQSELMQRIASLHEAREIVTAIRRRRRVRRSNKGEAPVEPRTPAEERMKKIWKEVLNLDEVGVHDNFFDLGGHSLLATQLLSRVHDEFEVRPSLRTVFEVPTIAGISEVIARDRNSLAAMLAQLSQISDEEAVRMIR